MKNLAILFLLFAVINTQAQNTCDFDSIYQETVRDERGYKTIFVNGNLFMASIKGYSDSYTLNNLFLKLTCLNTCGERVWKKQIDSSLGPISNSYGENLQFIDLIKRQNNTLLIAVRYSKVKPSIGAGIKLFNIDLAGNVIWKKTFGDTLSNYVLNSLTEINSNRYLMAGQKNGKAYFLICDTITQILNEGIFSIDTVKTSVIQKVQIMPDNTIKLLGLEDTNAFIKTIDTSGILINSIIIPTQKSHLVRTIAFNHDNSRIILTGLPYIAQYSLNGNLLKDTILPGTLLNQIKITQSDITKGVYINLEPNLNFLNTNKYWIKLDSNYNFISKDSFYFYTAGGYIDFYKLNNSIYGTGSLYSSGGLHVYFLSAIKKINLICYVTSIAITGPYAIYTKDGNLQLNINILPINANNKKIIWSINDSTIANINQNGLVTAKKDGIAIVYATTQDGSNLTAQKTISVNNQNVNIQQISIIGNDTIFIKNGFLQLSTQVLPTLATNKNIFWSINDTNIATIAQIGLLTAKANGTVIVTATAADGGGAKATKTVTISNQNTFVQQISIVCNDSIFTKRGSIQLNAQILPSNASSKQILWSVYDTNLASITPTGLLMAKADGTAYITATAADGGGAKATKAITITNQTVGINEVNLTNQIIVYPNPASNVLTIKSTIDLTGIQFQLLDITGKVIAQYHNQTEIDVSAIANGMYLLHIQTENGNVVKQVVINK